MFRVQGTYKKLKGKKKSLHTFFGYIHVFYFIFCYKILTYLTQGFTTREFTSTRFVQVNTTRKLDSRTRTSLPKIKIK